MLRLADVDIAYGDRVILRDIDLDFRSDHHHVVMGMSAGGKSSLMKAVIASRLTHVEVDLPTWTGQIELRRGVRIAYVPQESGLAHWLTIRENIELGRRLCDRAPTRGLGVLGDRVVAALGLEPWLDFVPAKVSVGTARRAALARAMVTEADLLLLDEPFSGLDFDLRERAIDLLLSEYPEGTRLIVMITHEPYEAAMIGRSVCVLPRTPAGSIRVVSRQPGEATSAYASRIRDELKMHWLE
jgi:sulfonate transport system ATP-binding protein